jgi:hypothetical protein
MANTSTYGIAVHSHDHKMTIAVFDDVQQNPQAWITRDVYWLGPFQCLDLALDTAINGLHSYGEGRDLAVARSYRESS